MGNRNFALALIFLVPFSLYATSFKPEALLQLDDHFSHHVLLAEKSTHQLHLYKNSDGIPQLIKTFQIATGKKAGDKIFQGDYRTPEGIYHFIDFLPRQELLKRHGKAGEIYGVGAFVMNYPNPRDKQESKTGGGIWLHSTNDETRIEKGLDSRGCVVAANNHLVEISKYIELNRTPIVVTQNVKYLTSQNWEKTRTSLHNFLESWRESWKNEDIKSYLSHYHSKEFTDKYRGDFRNFARYKRAVFRNPGSPDIKLSDISFLKSKDYVVATFKQLYQSKRINDIGKKSLYIKRDGYYNWKIVSETWTKAGLRKESDPVAFQPSMRFFKENSVTNSKN